VVDLRSQGLFSAFYQGAAAKFKATARVPSLGGSQQQIGIGAAGGEEGNQLNFRGLKCIAIKA